MPAMTIFFGLALMAVGIGTYVGTPSEMRELGDLLPALFGLIALTLAVGSIVKKDLRKHFMHGAMLLAALGVLVPLIRLGIYLAGMDVREQMRLIRVILTVAFSGAYVYFGVQSFRAARRAMKDGRAEPAPSADRAGTDRTPEPPPPPPAKPDPTPEA